MESPERQSVISYRVRKLSSTAVPDYAQFVLYVSIKSKKISFIEFIPFLPDVEM